MIEIKGAGKDYVLDGGILKAFDGIDLTIGAGEIVSVVGPSGCGKSSLLQAIAGLEPLSRGEIRFQGKPIEGPDGRIGVVFQEARLLPWLTVKENVALATRFRMHQGPGSGASVDDLLVHVGLEGFASAYPSQISGGMAQRAALARTLVQRPKIILFDEPFASLDALRRMELQVWLLGLLQEQETAALFVTHDLDEALIMGDRVAVMTGHPGRLHRVLDVPVVKEKSMFVEQPAFWELKKSILRELRAAGGHKELSAS